MTPHEQLADLTKVAPPVAVTSMTLAGYPMSDWVLALTAVYTILQISLVVRRLIVARRGDDSTCSARDCSGRKDSRNG